MSVLEKSLAGKLVFIIIWECERSEQSKLIKHADNANDAKHAN